MFVEENARELERLQSLVDRLSDGELRQLANEQWTVADVLGHMAFWDARTRFLAGKLERGEAFIDTETETDDVEWLNQSVWALIRGLEPRVVANLAVSIAGETDELVARLRDQIEAAGEIPFTPYRSAHRAEHLDEIERALRQP